MKEKHKTHMVVAGYLIHKNKILLVHHKKLNMWLPPGGHIEENETPDDALKREFKEEVGLDIEILNNNNVPEEGNIVKQLAVPFYVNVHNVGDHNHCCLFYLCVTKSPILTLNMREVKDCKWFSNDDLNQKNISPDVRNIALKSLETLKIVTH